MYKTTKERKNFVRRGRQRTNFQKSFWLTTKLKPGSLFLTFQSHCFGMKYLDIFFNLNLQTRQILN